MFAMVGSTLCDASCHNVCVSVCVSRDAQLYARGLVIFFFLNEISRHVYFCASSLEKLLKEIL